MTFVHPAYLVGLALVPLAIAAYVRHEHIRRLAVDAFASPALLASVAPSRPGWRRHGPTVAYVLALTVLLLALARPQTTVAVPVQRASIMLTTDYSGSMQSTDVAPTRLAAARAAALRFLKEVPGSVRVGLVAFNQTPRLVVSPTTERSYVRSALDALKPSGGTATGEALAVSLTALGSQTDSSGARVPGAIVLLSDGKSVRGRDPRVIAANAKKLKIPIYTVALGTPSGTIVAPGHNGVMETKPVPPDPSEMQAVAKISGGRAFSADNIEDLSSVYKLLGSKIGYRKQPRELTAAFSGGAMILMVAGALMSLLWFRRLV
jgi:Ca-activated chloride channel family protein